MRTPLKSAVEIAYSANFILLSLHEMDAIFWREWELLLGITDPAVGLPVFVLAHIPLYAVLFYGLLRVESVFGARLSAIFGALMLVHFVAHAIVLAVTGTFMHSALSFTILIGTALVSPVQIWLTLRLIRGR